MDIGNAIAALREGDAVTREGWNGAGQFLRLQVPDAHSLMTLPYIYITTVQGDRVPWLASQTDILAEDWYVLLPVEDNHDEDYDYRVAEGDNGL